MWFLLIIPLIIYWMLISWFVSGWLKLNVIGSKIDEFKALDGLEGKHLGHNKIRVSVLIPFRNEAEHLQRFLMALDNQEFDKEHLEIIFIDDHSTDNSSDIIRDYTFKAIRPILLKSNDNEQGKKAALKKGIKLANGEIIVCTDADCFMDKYWLSTMASAFCTNEIKMVSGPVVFFERHGFWNQIMQLEFLSLIGTGAASIGNGYPNMCNGANIAYLKSVFFEMNGFDGNEHILSGDDEFLLHKISEKNKNAIRFIKNPNAMVFTESPRNLNAFINQRIRWGSKAVHYKSFKNKLLPAFIFSFNVTLLFTSFLWIFGMPWTLIAILWIGKLLADLVFFAVILPFFNHSKLLEFVIPTQILHVAYISIIGILSVTKSYVWKGRPSKGAEMR